MQSVHGELTLAHHRTGKEGDDAGSQSVGWTNMFPLRKKYKGRRLCVSQSQIEMSVEEPVASFEVAITRTQESEPEICHDYDGLVPVGKNRPCGEILNISTWQIWRNLKCLHICHMLDMILSTP